MFYACTVRFDVTRNLENFLDFGWTKQDLVLCALKRGRARGWCQLVKSRHAEDRVFANRRWVPQMDDDDDILLSSGH